MDNVSFYFSANMIQPLQKNAFENKNLHIKDIPGASNDGLL